MTAPRRNKTVAADQVIYLGREFAGGVTLRNGKWRAVDVNGRVLGHFANRLEAAAAVLQGARRQ